MSLRCAMSRMRVIGTEHVNSLEKLGSHGCRWRMSCRSTDETGAPCLPYRGFSPATVSRLMKTSRDTTAGRSGRWWWPSSAHSMCPAAIQRRNVEVAASFSTDSSWPWPTMDWMSSSLVKYEGASREPAITALVAGERCGLEAT